MDFIQQNENISAEEKSMLAKEVKKVGSDLEIAEFKLERTEKVKRTTAILLEETIEELEQKRKAVESQNRELEIEASLERVRSNAMAMRSSDELNTIIGKVFTECIKLDIQLDRGMIMIFDPDSLDSWWWMANPEAPDLPRNYHVPYHVYKPYLEYLDGWKKRTVRWTYELEGKEKKDWDAHIFVNSELSLLPIEVKEVMTGFPKVYLNASFNNFGGLTLASIDPMSDEHFDILLRFAKVFDLTYTRFNDLKQAEAQTREAQIEVALERVRARAMAMHSSGELKEVVHELRKQMGFLGQKDMDTCVIHLHDESPDFINAWAAIQPPESKDEIIESTARVPKKGLLIIEEALEAYSSNQQDYVIINEGFKIRQWFKFIQKESPEAFNKIEESAESTNAADPISYWSFSDFPGGSLLMVTIHQPTITSRNLLRRFANVFGLAYRRFVDLKQAEAQTREAQIEASLERIRARSMAMQRSNELAEAAQLLYQQFHSLGIKTYTCAYMFIEEERNRQRGWAVASDGTLLPDFFDFPLTGDPILDQRFVSWKNKEPIHETMIQGEANKQHHAFLVSMQSPDFAQHIVAHLPDRVFFYNANFLHGYLFIVNTELFTSEEKNIAIRFAKVFEQTYTRFLDLQKAEAQAREAQIEAALEKVRSRSLAMHHSAELEQVAVSLFDRLVELGLTLDGALIFIFDKEKRNIQLWIATNHLPVPVKIDLPFDEEIKNNTVIKDLWNAIENGEHILNRSYSGETKNDYFRYVAKYNESKVPESVRKIQIESDSWTANLASEKNALIGFDSWSGHKITNEDFQTLIRFSRVFEQAYTRFLDLQKAEKQAREAVKQSSLDRVRGQIASMRSVDDLQRITPLIWHELIALGVPFVRCGVFIMNEETSHVQAFLSAPDGHSLAALDLPFDSSELTKNSVNFWRKGLVYKAHWNKEEFLKWMKSMIKEGQVQSPETYQGASTPPESLDLHFVPFAQGMLYVGNIHPLKKDELDLVKSLAEAFSIAYARYEDFKKLEIAKQSIETTLSELKAAQSQLIQAEKMASLGELTAGIAHEIQNPLNFVNNFSEVNTELIEEMKTELKAGNTEDAIAIANDIADNEQKINHHGKRADAIVKGMLQHSRKSSGVKEPTNINALADEYLRLAYHGLRAKDKSFNATMKTDFDETIGKIDVIQQDIGRVILNLITNAFYTVNEKKQQAPPPPEGGIYEPTVTVRTSLNPPSGGRGAEVLISVCDNGNGIPQKAMDKIFQPFFTTKPTGQGTGLGLSLAYDIVKAHGGELKVVTKEGEGSEFIIQIPGQT